MEEVPLHLVYDGLEHVEGSRQLVFGDVERRLDLDQVAEAGVAALTEDHTTRLSALEDFVGCIRGRFLGVTVLHELDRHHEARAADVADDLEPVLRLQQAGVSASRWYARPGVIIIPITDLDPCRVALAWWPEDTALVADLVAVANEVCGAA